MNTFNEFILYFVPQQGMTKSPTSTSPDSVRNGANDSLNEKSSKKVLTTLTTLKVHHHSQTQK